LARPDPSLLQGVVAREVLEAMRVASAALKRAGVRHLVVGGRAVGANGFPRATKDVNFLVGDEAFEQHEGGLVTLRSGVPFQVNRVAVDFIGAEASEAFLAAELDAEAGSMTAAEPTSRPTPRRSSATSTTRSGGREPRTSKGPSAGSRPAHTASADRRRSAGYAKP
jgi:hypothetical protein